MCLCKSDVKSSCYPYKSVCLSVHMEGLTIYSTDRVRTDGQCMCFRFIRFISLAKSWEDAYLGEHCLLPVSVGFITH